MSVVFEPDEHTSLENYAWTRDHLILVTLVDVASRVEVVTPGSWERAPIAGIPPNTNTMLVDVDEYGDEMFLDSSGFDSPSRLLWGRAGDDVTEIKSAPAFFDASDIEVTQHFVASADGTMIPYFVVGHRSSTGPGKTLLSGYGGFESSSVPGYGGVLGRLWLSRGGTYVLANIRGGGEYGPRWHTQAMREGRHLVDEDFAAVARDLVDRGITTVEQLGAQGGSNGGLLMGIMLTQVPRAVRRAGVQRAAAGHATVPPAAGRRVVGRRVRRPGQPRRLGVHLQILAVSEYFDRPALPAGVDHHVHP